MSANPILITSSIDMDTNSYTGYSHFIINAGQASVTITLPSFIYDGASFTFIRTDSSGNSVTLIPSVSGGNDNGSNLSINTNVTIGGNSFASLGVRQMVTLVALGTNWICPIVTYTF